MEKERMRKGGSCSEGKNHPDMKVYDGSSYTINK